MKTTEKAIRLFLAFLPLLITGGDMPTLQGPSYPHGFIVSPATARESGAGDLSHNVYGYITLDHAATSQTNAVLMLPRKFQTVRPLFRNGIMNSGDAVISFSVLEVPFGSGADSEYASASDAVVSISSGDGLVAGPSLDVSELPLDSVIRLYIQRDPTHASDTFGAGLRFVGWQFE